jgi:hypothetical protein
MVEQPKAKGQQLTANRLHGKTRKNIYSWS